MVEVVLSEEVVERRLPGPHGVVEAPEGAVERTSVHQGQRPHRPGRVRAQQGTEFGQAESVLLVLLAGVLGDGADHGEVAQEYGQTPRVAAGQPGEVLGAAGGAGVHDVGQAQPGERGECLGRPRPGEQVEERFGGLPHVMAGPVQVGGEGVPVVAPCVEFQALVVAGRVGEGEVEDRAVLVRVVAAAVGLRAVTGEDGAQAAQGQRLGVLDLEGEVRLVPAGAFAGGDRFQVGVRGHGQGEHLDRAPFTGGAEHVRAQDLDVELGRVAPVAPGEAFADHHAGVGGSVHGQSAVGELGPQAVRVRREEQQPRVGEPAVPGQRLQVRAAEAGQQEREQGGAVVLADEPGRRAQAGGVVQEQRFVGEGRRHRGGVLGPVRGWAGQGEAVGGVGAMEGVGAVGGVSGTGAGRRGGHTPT